MKIIDVKFPLLLSNLKESLIFWTDFRRGWGTFKFQISWKSF